MILPGAVPDHLFYLKYIHLMSESDEHKALSSYLALMVVFHLPTPGQLQLFVGKHVEEAHQIPVVLVALEVVGVPPDFGDHVLQTRVVCKHAVGTLRNNNSKGFPKRKLLPPQKTTLFIVTGPAEEELLIPLLLLTL